jgi:hypothetical protein
MILAQFMIYCVNFSPKIFNFTFQILSCRKMYSKSTSFSPTQLFRNMAHTLIMRLERCAGHILLIAFINNYWQVYHICIGKIQPGSWLGEYRYVLNLHGEHLSSFRLTLRKRKTVGGLRPPQLSPVPKVEEKNEDLDEEPKDRQSGICHSMSSKHLRRIVNVNCPNGKKRLPKFYLYCHKPSQVASAILLFLPDMENLRKLGVSEIDKAFLQLRKYEELRQRPNQNPEDTSVLAEYLHLFDEMYFCGALANLIYVEVAPRGFEGLETTDYGDFCSHRDGGLWTPHVDFQGRIRIGDLKEQKRFSDPETRLHHYLGTLLHEAIHAMFELYVCYGHRRCRSREIRYMDWDGHGKLFTKVAARIEVATEILHKGSLSIR